MANRPFANKNYLISSYFQILDKAHSRIPVYEGDRENIVGLLLVKTLIKLDPEDATPVRSLLDDGDVRPILHTTEDKPLFDLLNEFQEGKGQILQLFFSHVLLFSCLLVLTSSKAK